MHQVRSTYKIIINRIQQRLAPEDCKDWALEMMEAGFETPHLIILAGLSSGISYFECEDVFRKAIKELSLDSMSDEEVVRGYVCYLIDQALSSKMSRSAVLSILRNLYLERDSDKELFDFSCLFYAQQELEVLGEQYYWEGANKENINSIIDNEFIKWRNKHAPSSK